MMFRTLIIAMIAATSPALAGEWIQGRVTHVRDVDTIEVKGLPVRLDGIDGPELGDRAGKAGKRWMQALVLNRPVRCELSGARTYDRWVGVCYLNGQDIGALTVAAGHARDCPRYSKGRYARFETEQSLRIPASPSCRRR